MHGTLTIPFSELFADSVRTHGTIWAWDHYVKKGGMPEWEYKFWLLSMWGLTAPLRMN